ncbi:glycerol kinase GlpK [Mucisphaera sp.]|uniref:glycerol kinase GlpK n=1 Tax=Mucisphaera sp. TaxID=2913024 RepID=UPI003D1530D3
MPHILALDQGTTSSRAILFDQTGSAVASAQQEINQHYPQPGWVEHDPDEIWRTQLQTARAVLQQADIPASDVAAIGITNQRETSLLWDRRTGKTLGRAIVWQDRRTADKCEAIHASGQADDIRQRTGLVIDPYFSATKIQWLLDHHDGARAAAEKGNLAFGTVDTWLLWKLTSGRTHATDASNASRTMLYNIHEGRWDPDLLGRFEIPAGMLPEVHPSSGVVATIDPDLLGHPIPVTGIAGDQQAALFGQACFEPGVTKCTYGTGCFMLMNTGASPVPSRSGLLTTIGWQLADETTYALEGSVFVAGAAVQWLRDGLGLIRKSSDIEALARSAKDNGGVYFVPALTGLGAPSWDPHARGAIVGLTRSSTAANLARATLEGMAHQVADVLELMVDDSGIQLKDLRVDGGASKNDLLMQLQADLLGTDLIRPVQTETTAWGTACLAGLGIGLWDSREQLTALTGAADRFKPSLPSDRRASERRQWRRALGRSLSWESE